MVWIEHLLMRVCLLLLLLQLVHTISIHLRQLLLWWLARKIPICLWLLLLLLL